MKYLTGPVPHAALMECIRLYGEKVIPMVRIFWPKAKAVQGGQSALLKPPDVAFPAWRPATFGVVSREPGPILSRIFLRTGRAADALFIDRVRLNFRRDRPAAGPATVIATGHQPMPNRHPVIENKALPLPKAFGFGDVLKVFQDATLQVVNLIKPLA